MGNIEEKSGHKKSVNRILLIIGNVLVYVFFALCVCLLIITVASKKSDDGATTIFGHETRIVLTGSMDKSELTDVSSYKIKSIPVNSMVFIEKVPEDSVEAAKWYDSLEVGDVLTIKYVYSTQMTITHRLVEKTPNPNGGYTLVLEGDNKTYNPNQNQQTIETWDEDSPNYVIGKVTGQSKFFGFIVSSMKRPLGIVLVIIIPCLIIIILEIIHIVGVLGSHKKEKMAAESKKQSDEIEELKRKLASLEQQNAQATANQPLDENSSKI